MLAWSWASVIWSVSMIFFFSGDEGEDGVTSWPSIARFVKKMSFTSPISFSRGEKASSPLMVAI